MHIDLFCEVVDNYGDIGVCWRLAQQLQHHAQLRLFINDLHAFQRIEPLVNPNLHKQTIQNTQVLSWQEAKHSTPASIVIEAFACQLPASFRSLMHNTTKLWINLEYLSAESWVESVHKMPSPQSNGVPKYFFFPGFNAKTGGLLRSHTTQPIALDSHFWQQLGLSSAPTTDKVAFVFPYPTAPLDLLYSSLAAQPNSWSVLLAATAPTPTAEQAQRLPIYRLPFIAQAQFDALLDYADLNIVRGEDSFIRAIWAEKPFIWQPYLQEEQAHLVKLGAWLETTPLESTTQHLIQHWNDGQLQAQELNQVLLTLTSWQRQCQLYAKHLSQHTDLATQLLAFCSQINQKTVK